MQIYKKLNPLLVKKEPIHLSTLLLLTLGLLHSILTCTMQKTDKLHSTVQILC